MDREIDPQVICILAVSCLSLLEQEVKRCIVTYAEGAHEELLEVSRPTYEAFALKHGYDFMVGKNEWKILENEPAPWKKISILYNLLQDYSEVVWFDCDLVVVDKSGDFLPIEDGKVHSLVRHFEDYSEVPNTGVWRLRKNCGDLRGTRLLDSILELKVFKNHGWWEQAALMTLMGYTVPPEGSVFTETRCRNVQKTTWYNSCQFMRLAWNSHPNYRAERPRVVHCSYPDMRQRLEVMRALVRDPSFDYPRYDSICDYCKKPIKTEEVSD